MNAPSTCLLPNRDELARAYVTRELAGSALDDFEGHFLTCGQCQAEVRLALALRNSLQPPPALLPARRRWITTSALAVAAALVLIAWPRQPDVSALAELAAPPVYLGVPVRAGEAFSLFENGMRLYQESRWRAAADTLYLAAAAGAGADASLFFAAASELLGGRPAVADTVFAQVIALGDGPYFAESMLYRAKSLMQLRRPSDALDLLRKVPVGTAVAAHAAALADSLMELGVR